MFHTHQPANDDRYGRVAPLAVRQGVARPRRRRASMPEVLYSAMRPTVEPVAAAPPPAPPLSARPALGQRSPPSKPQRPTSSPPLRRPRRLSKEFFPASFVTTTSAAAQTPDTDPKPPPRPPPERQRRASRDSIRVEAKDNTDDEATGKGALWARVRGLLWRILDPAAAFPHLVRRTLSVHRACMLLRRTAPALAALGHVQIVAMVCAASEPPDPGPNPNPDLTLT